MAEAERPGRVAIVTGSASGIGRAAALRLARDGYAVACLDIDEGGAKSAAEEILAAGGIGLGMHLDVSSEVDVAGTFAEISTELGPPSRPCPLSRHPARRARARAGCQNLATGDRGQPHGDLPVRPGGSPPHGRGW